MEEYTAKKEYGQNFLIDQNIVTKIANSIDLTTEDLIIEIGPGKGFLTKELIKYGSYLIAYEIDEEMHPFLDKYCQKNCIIKYENFLHASLKEDIPNIKFKNIYLIANIPYYITTPIIKKILNSKINFNKVVLMVQKEYADRITSLPKDSEYGSLTVFLNYYYEVNKLFDVSRKSFDPIPKVDSSVIEMIPASKKNEVSDFDFFKRIVKESFLHRRKTIKNNLKKYDLNLIDQILKTNGYSLSSRAQDIDLQTYVEMSNVLSQKK